MNQKFINPSTAPNCVKQYKKIPTIISGGCIATKLIKIKIKKLLSSRLLI